MAGCVVDRGGGGRQGAGGRVVCGGRHDGGRCGGLVARAGGRRRLRALRGGFVDLRGDKSRFERDKKLDRQPPTEDEGLAPPVPGALDPVYLPGSPTRARAWAWLPRLGPAEAVLQGAAAPAAGTAKGKQIGEGGSWVWGESPRWSLPRPLNFACSGLRARPQLFCQCRQPQWRQLPQRSQPGQPSLPVCAKFSCCLCSSVHFFLLYY